ncbi:hypothetical protein LLS1_24530 [Leifsonia sp. LS1]|uniref:hypothetical protein n=1 Tax=Leifsonia sp. LS1 TaxID=2828483 RepID=UPI001CFC8018|nr:hypothetical protein [Leifsonia sp. LS1]GIT80784.1 hypothetical protein LLS1_24530 [Leifsonia sp. LS1]
MTALGVVFLLGALACLAFRRDAFVVVVAASAGVPASAAITVGSISISPFQMLGVICAIALLFTARRVSGGAGHVPMVMFTAWCVLITAAGPLIFAGLDVLPARKGVDIAVRSPEALTYTVSTIAQTVYLLIGFAVIVYFVVTKRSPLLAAIPLAVGTVLSSLRIVSGLVGVRWPAWIFDNATNVIYADETSRARGVLAEPSELAGFSLAALAFGVACCVSSRVSVRLLGAGLSLLALMNLLLSGSGTAVVAGAVLAAIAGVVSILRAVREDSPRVIWLSLVALALILGAVLAGNRLASWATDIVTRKVGSASMGFRSSADSFSLEIVRQTFGLGVGLGGNRPSSFALMLLSNVGVVGFVLLAVAIAALVRHAYKARSAVPACWSLVGLLIAKIIGLPDLSTPILWVLLAACAAAVWTTQDRQPLTRRTLPSVPSTIPSRKRIPCTSRTI